MMEFRNTHFFQFFTLSILVLCHGLAYSAPRSQLSSRQASASNEADFSFQVQYANSSLDEYFITDNDVLTGLGSAPRISFEWMPINSFGKLSIGFAISLYGKRDQAISNGRDASVVVVPLDLLLTYRFDASGDQTVVPFGRVGASHTWLKQYSQTGNNKALQRSWGFRFGGGVEFLLNNIEPYASDSLKKNFGIDRTYLVLEALRTSNIKQSSSPDFSLTSYLAGLRLEF